MAAGAGAVSVFAGAANDNDASAQSAGGAHAPDQISQLAYDLAGRKLSEQCGVGSTTPITYATWTYGYDGFNRLSQTTFPSTTLGAGVSDPTNYESYTYDGNSNRLKLRRRDGNTITSVYDVLDRETSRTYTNTASLPVYSGYDLAGRELSATYNSATGPGVSWLYYAAGRLTQETQGAYPVYYQYDNDSNRSAFGFPGNAWLNYTFDGNDRMTWVGAGGVVGMSPGYDSLGRLNAVTPKTTARATALQYDNADRLSQMAQTFTGGAGNVTFSFGYTPGGQVASSAASIGRYDWTGVAGSQVNNTPDGLNRDAALASLNPPCAGAGRGTTATAT